MKKVLGLVLSLAMLLSLCGCGNNAAKDESNTAPVEGTGADKTEEPHGDFGAIGDVDVDAGLFNVTITVPSDFVEEGTTQEQLDEIVKENGYKSAILNDDGSVSYVMTKSQHKEMMEGIKDSIDESLAELASSEEYANIVSIEANDDYTKYKVTLASDEVDLMSGIAVMGLYIFSGMYHVFNGTDLGNINIQYINEATGEVMEEANSSDMG